MTDTTPDTTHLDEKPNLWNPLALFLWSLLLTPIFGIFFQAKNWKTLNNNKKFKTSLIWGGVYVAYTIFHFIVLAITDFNNPSNLLNISLGVGLILFLLWVALDAGAQRKYLKENNIEYNKKSLFKPVGIGAVAMAIYLLLAAWVMIPSVEEQAAELVTKIYKENYGSKIKCVKVKVDTKVTDELYKGTAYLDNGAEWKISIITKDDKILVKLLKKKQW